MKKLVLAVVLWFAASGLSFAAVNINTATVEELTTLKGVGEKRAQEIIDYRKKHGNFKSVDDLGKVPGIGPGLMKQIRSQITVTGTTSVDKSADKDSKAKAGAAKTTAAPKADAIKSNAAKDNMATKFKADEKKIEKK
jgi:competence protein ComEA